MGDNPAKTTAGPKRCFVVMGFGIKTDYATGRKLDLDKSYRNLIKPAVEEAGLICVRADEIVHSGIIDVPMYRELLTADVVVADLSTANPNALYELGIRHALKPRTTIVISENKLTYPFDLNHILITSYTHLGDVIDYDEALRFQKVLVKMLKGVESDPRPDSPVYTFLEKLTPPFFGETVEQALERGGEVFTKQASPTPKPGPQDKTLSVLVEQGEQALQTNSFTEAKALFSLAIKLSQGGGVHAGSVVRHDPYLTQRLVLATYKDKQPDELSALREAKERLALLDPEESNDPETVGLAGAIEKRLFDKGQGAEHLDQAIRYYGRGYYLRTDRYNGINLAYLLNVRTDTPLDSTDAEKIADLVGANRLRREVVALCEKEWAEIQAREARIEEARPDELSQALTARDKEQKFWCLVSEAEARFGLGEIEEYERLRSQAQILSSARWMMTTFDEQIGRLRDLLAKHGHLLSPQS